MFYIFDTSVISRNTAEMRDGHARWTIQVFRQHACDRCSFISWSRLKKMVNSKGLLLMKICKRKLICFKLCFKVCGWMAGRETYVGVVNVTKMLDEVTVSFCPLKLRALSLASVPFHALPSSTHFFLPRDTRVCFYCATWTIEKI